MRKNAGLERFWLNFSLELFLGFRFMFICLVNCNVSNIFVCKIVLFNLFYQNRKSESESEEKEESMAHEVHLISVVEDMKFRSRYSP